MTFSIQSGEILETIRMVVDQDFDVRTITIGIDLHDCIDRDITQLNRNIYDKITRTGERLVETASLLSAKYGVPICNQRIAVTPIAQVAAATGGNGLRIDRANFGSSGQSDRHLIHWRLLGLGAKRHESCG